jgi:hypothetical protein
MILRYFSFSSAGKVHQNRKCTMFIHVWDTKIAPKSHSSGANFPLAGMGLRLVCPRRGAGAVPAAAAEATEATEPLFREELKRLEQLGLNPRGFIAGRCGFR